MKISITRSGGFANITLPAKVLTTQDKDTIALVNKIGSSPSTYSNGHAKDGMNYKVSIDYDDGNHVSFNLVEPDSDDFFNLLEKVNAG